MFKSLDADNIDTDAILSDAAKILQKYEDSREILFFEEWPQSFEKIGAKSVVVRDDGLYILLSSFFVQEKGLFIPREGVNMVVGTEFDPSY